jgi:hypothetical protein
MVPDHDSYFRAITYRVGLDKINEAVISSHFMHKLANDRDLHLYNDEDFSARSLKIDSQAVTTALIPGLLAASDAFCADRAATATPRARTNYRKYGLGSPRDIGAAESITEVMFDPHYLRGPKDSCSRHLLCSRVRDRIENGAPIEMAIPALPFKLSSPLKTRGQLPDLAEINFILELYEIAASMELIYREARPDLRERPLVRFIVVSDGSRFSEIVNESDSAVERYRSNLDLWIERLQLDSYIGIQDYRSLFRERLPASVAEQKSRIRSRARSEYADAMLSIFDPYQMAATLRAAGNTEPDPERSNTEGRFGSLVQSLVFTINYRALEKLAPLPADRYRRLYRELTAHIFEPFLEATPFELGDIQQEIDADAEAAFSDHGRECLRQAMLREAWTCAIDYIAEIKSDRELQEDPLLTCLPDHFRWTIHAKPGQLALLAPTALGLRVQPWAGAAVFKATKNHGIRLCTLPVLALEGVGAIPVMVSENSDAFALTGQPFFYIYPDIEFSDLDDFLRRVQCSLVRKRMN